MSEMSEEGQAICSAISRALAEFGEHGSEEISGRAMGEAICRMIRGCRVLSQDGAWEIVRDMVRDELIEADREDALAEGAGS